MAEGGKRGAMNDTESPSDDAKLQEPNTGPLYLEHPKFEGFEVRQTVTRSETAAA